MIGAMILLISSALALDDEAGLHEKRQTIFGLLSICVFVDCGLYIASGVSKELILFIPYFA